MAEYYKQIQQSIATANTDETITGTPIATGKAWLVKHLTITNQDAVAIQFRIATPKSGDITPLEWNYRFPPGFPPDSLDPGAVYSDDVNWFLDAGDRIIIRSTSAVCNFIFDVVELDPNPF